MARLILTCLSLLTAWLGLAGPASARSHVALVIDNAPAVAAGSAGDKVALFARSLERLSYGVTLAKARDNADLRRLLAKFATDAKGAEVAVFYFKGPAIHDNGRNLLLAPDHARSTRMDDMAVAVAEIEALLTASKANVLLIDPNTPDRTANTLVGASADRTFTLSRFKSRPGLLIASANSASSDLRLGEANVFSNALTSVASHSEFDWNAFATKLRWETFQRSRGGQVPMILNGLSSPVKMAALGDTKVPLTLPAPKMTDSLRTGLITQVETELKARACHAGAVDGDAAAAARSLELLSRQRQDAPKLDIASATPDEYEIWLDWLRSTRGHLCAPDAPVTVPPPASRPNVAKPEPDEPPARRRTRRATPREDPPERKRRAEREDRPSRREAPVRRRNNDGGGGGGGGGRGPSIRIPSF
ncbi:MAG: hypothetical protein R3D67_21920 [Hyphomicrobiaceae bacterium]